MHFFFTNSFSKLYQATDRSGKDVTGTIVVQKMKKKNFRIAELKENVLILGLAYLEFNDMNLIDR